MARRPNNSSVPQLRRLRSDTRQLKVPLEDRKRPVLPTRTEVIDVTIMISVGPTAPAFPITKTSCRPPGPTPTHAGSGIRRKDGVSTRGHRQGRRLCAGAQQHGRDDRRDEHSEPDGRWRGSPRKRARPSPSSFARRARVRLGRHSRRRPKPIAGETSRFRFRSPLAGTVVGVSASTIAASGQSQWRGTAEHQARSGFPSYPSLTHPTDSAPVRRSASSRSPATRAADHRLLHQPERQILRIHRADHHRHPDQRRARSLAPIPTGETTQDIDIARRLLRAAPSTSTSRQAIKPAGSRRSAAWRIRRQATACLRYCRAAGS